MFSDKNPQGASGKEWGEGASLPQRPPALLQQREIAPPQSFSRGGLGGLLSWMSAEVSDETRRREWLNTFSVNYALADQIVKDKGAQLLALEGKLKIEVPRYQALEAAGRSPLELHDAKAQLEEYAVTKNSLEAQFFRAARCRQVNHILRTKMEEAQPLPSVSVSQATGVLSLLGRLVAGARASDKMMESVIKNVSGLGVDPRAKALPDSESIINSLIDTYGDKSPSRNSQGALRNRGGELGTT